MVVVANWPDFPQIASFSIDEEKLGFTPGSYLLPEIRNLQWEGKLNHLNNIEITGRGGKIIVLE